MMAKTSWGNYWKLVVAKGCFSLKLDVVRKNLVSPGKNSMSSVSTVDNKHLCVIFPTPRFRYPHFIMRKHTLKKVIQDAQLGKMDRGSIGQNPIIHQTHSYFMVLKIDQIVSINDQHKPVYLE